MSMILALVLNTSAVAGGYYHPADIAQASEIYGQSAENAGNKAMEVERQADAIAQALVIYEENLDLFSIPSDDPRRAHQVSTKKSFNREVSVVREFVNAMLEDFDAEFSMAMERAVAKHSGAVECVAQIPVGRPLPGIPSRMKDNPDCKGDNLNQAIAKSMDADPKLRAAVDEILALEWPSITDPNSQQTPVGQSPSYMDAHAFFSKTIGDGLAAIRKSDGMARSELQLAVDEGAANDDLKTMVAEAQRITAQTFQARAALADPVLKAIDAFDAKRAKKGQASTAWCLQPKRLGGCTGDDKTASQIELILADKRVMKSLH